MEGVEQYLPIELCIFALLAHKCDVYDCAMYTIQSTYQLSNSECTSFSCNMWKIKDTQMKQQ